MPLEETTARKVLPCRVSNSVGISFVFRTLRLLDFDRQKPLKTSKSMDFIIRSSVSNQYSRTFDCASWAPVEGVEIGEASFGLILWPAGRLV